MPCDKNAGVKVAPPHQSILSLSVLHQRFGHGGSERGECGPGSTSQPARPLSCPGVCCFLPASPGILRVLSHCSVQRTQQKEQQEKQMSSFLANFVSENPSYMTEPVMQSTKTVNWMEICGYAEVSLLMFRIKTDGINCKCKIISLKQNIVMDQGCPILNFHIFLIFFLLSWTNITSVQMRRLAQAAKCGTSREHWF